MKVLLIDNDDPSAPKLATYLRELGTIVEMYRNDELEVDEIRERAPARIVIASGVDTPAEAGISLPVIRELGVDTPMLGIGLGHLAMAVAFGGRTIPASNSYDEAPAPITHTGIGVLRNIPSPTIATADHDLIVERLGLPDSLQVTAWNAEGVIMGLRHRTLPIDGVQFKLEPPIAMRILRNFLETGPSST